MAALILPAGVSRVPSSECPSDVRMFPFGHTYKTSCGVFFRFTPHGGRWGKEHGLSTSKGIVTTQGMFKDSLDGSEKSFTSADKADAITHLLNLLAQGK